MWQIWLILAGIFIIFEMVIPPDFLIFWVGIGAGITSIFYISSVLLLFCTKPFVRKFTRNSANIKTNAYSIIGKTGIVISDIDPISGKGQVKVDNEIWSAKTNSTKPINKDTIITVKAIDGVKLVVTTEKELEEIKN